MKYAEFLLAKKHGQDIFACEWKPDIKAKAVIALVHGLGEHSGRYHHVAEFYTKNGFGLISFDLYGHGKSGGERGHLPEEDTFLSSVDDLLSYADSQYLKLPVILRGHSLGGEIVLWYSIKRKPKMNGVVASAPFFASFEPVSPVKLFLAKTMRSIFPAFSMDSGLNTNALSRDKKVVAKYKEDPLVHSAISARLGWTMLEKGKWMLEHAKDFPLPLLLMVGTGESLVARSKIDEFAKQVPNIEYKIWDGLYHELHNEPEKETVLKYELGWIKKHLQ